MKADAEPVTEIDGVPQYAQAEWEGHGTIIADTPPEVADPEPVAEAG